MYHYLTITILLHLLSNINYQRTEPTYHYQGPTNHNKSLLLTHVNLPETHQRLERLKTLT